MIGVRLLITILLIAAFGVFAVFLILNADTRNATEWERWVYVFGAVEALAFTAVGWLFGREVNRERAEQAEGRADAAEEDSVAAQRAGNTLAGMVAAAEATESGRQRLEPQGPERAAPDALRVALEYARRHYDV